MFDEHTHNRHSHGRRELEGSSGGSIWYFPIPGEFVSSVLRRTAAKVRFRVSDSGMISFGFRPGFTIPVAGRSQLAVFRRQSTGRLRIPSQDVKRSGLKSLPLDVENPGGDNSRLTKPLRLWTNVRRKRQSGDNCWKFLLCREENEQQTPLFSFLFFFECCNLSRDMYIVGL
ncbi:hypothetical protein OROGR_017086 [Orobanche gracilis]